MSEKEDFLHAVCCVCLYPMGVIVIVNFVPTYFGMILTWVGLRDYIMNVEMSE